MPEETGPYELTILRQSNQCGVSKPTLRELQSLEEIRQITASGFMLQTDQPLPDVDLSSHAVMLLAMGERPSAGYAIEVDPEPLHKDGQTIRLNVKFTAPDKDAFVATMITRPCLIFSIRRDGVSEIVAGETGLFYRF
jgi:hypothetical protein